VSACCGDQQQFSCSSSPLCFGVGDLDPPYRVK
jgi:hypothetical protein